MDTKLTRAAIACLLAGMVLTGCGNTDSSSSSPAADSEIITETETTSEAEATEPTTEESETTTAEPSTEAAEPTAAPTESEETKQDFQPVAAPFGDISGAYICVGGIAFTPSVYVLSEDDKKELSAIIDSIEWEELDGTPKVPYTAGANGLAIYFNNNGKCSMYDPLSSAYNDENRRVYYREHYSDKDTPSMYDAVSEMAYNNSSKNDPSRMVTTHLGDELNLPPDHSLQDYWDLIWQDVIPFIESTQE